MDFKQLDKKKVAIAALAVVVLGASLLLLLRSRPPQWREVMELHEIAYDSLGRHYRSQDDITVYIRENGVWEPFLVLEARYPGRGNGGTLLLRRYLMQERVAWLSRERLGAWDHREIGKLSEYYPMSDIDTWLETEYIQRFSSRIRRRILITNIEVWDGRNHAPEGSTMITTRTEHVPRRIFLLSLEEMSWRERRSRPNRDHATEGETIAYFDIQNHQELWQRSQATPRHEYKGDWHTPGGAIPRYPSYNWWLRSVRWTAASNTIATVMNYGGVQAVGAGNYRFVRPAFTMPPDTIIMQYEIDGRFVYVIHD